MPMSSTDSALPNVPFSDFKRSYVNRYVYFFLSMKGAGMVLINK